MESIKMADNEKKIIIDDDWKQQAKAEKEKLAEQAKQEKEQKKEERQFPEGNFSSLVSMLTTQILFALGVIAPKGTEKDAVEPDFEMAKYNIDILADLQEKTKGNLSEKEADMLKQTVSQLQMAFVQIVSSGDKEAQ